jgi:hypothetical protein
MQHVERLAGRTRIVDDEVLRSLVPIITVYEDDVLSTPNAGLD